MSAIFMNIAVGLVTSFISGAAVWGWGRARLTQRQRELGRFFGLSPGDKCRIIAPQAYGISRAIAKNDVFSIVEIAELARDLKVDLDLFGAGEAKHGVGDVAEFCVGGPAANVRAQSHIARFLPGVSFAPGGSDGLRKNTIVAGGQIFQGKDDANEYVLLARVMTQDGGRPLFLVCGQTSVTNRAAASYLRENYRGISSDHRHDENWCVILRVVDPSVYGHLMTEVAADVSAVAFARPASSAG